MLPKHVKNLLWSNDLKKIDPERDKKRIIINVLKYGSRESTDWLFTFYPKSEIKRVFRDRSAQKSLDAKSINYWSIILGK